MKKSMGLTVILGLAAMMLNAAEPVREIRILTIGNSFSNSVFGSLQSIVKSDPSCKIVMDRAALGGCTLQRHWEEHLKSEKDPKYKVYDKGTRSLRDKLTQTKWDIVTIQQASHKSWIAESYQPYADHLIKLIRELAPSAEIVIQQTWSYIAGAPHYSRKDWKIDQTVMYEKLNENYRTLAKKYGFRIIPAGYAVQIYRKNIGDKLVKVNVDEIKKMKHPQRVANNDVVGNFSWRKNKKNGTYTMSTDWIHLNADGRYLQGLVWYGFLFGKDPVKAAYVPKNMKPERAAFLKKCAAEAVAAYPQVKK